VSKFLIQLNYVGNNNGTRIRQTDKLCHNVSSSFPFIVTPFNYNDIVVADILLDHFIANKMMEEEMRDEVRKVMTAQHVFAHQKRKRSLMPGSAEDKALMKKNLSKGEAHIFLRYKL